MLGKSQCTHADEHDHCREEDAPLVRRQEFSPIGVLIEQTFGHEYRIVVPLSEDKGCQNHIDEVETKPKNRHTAQNPQPTHHHGEES